MWYHMIPHVSFMWLGLNVPYYVIPHVNNWLYGNKNPRNLGAFDFSMLFFQRDENLTVTGHKMNSLDAIVDIN